MEKKEDITGGQLILIVCVTLVIVTLGYSCLNLWSENNRLEDQIVRIERANAIGDSLYVTRLRSYEFDREILDFSYMTYFKLFPENMQRVLILWRNRDIKKAHEELQEIFIKAELERNKKSK